MSVPTSPYEPLFEVKPALSQARVFPLRTMIAGYLATILAGGLFGVWAGPVGVMYGGVISAVVGSVVFSLLAVVSLFVRTNAGLTLLALTGGGTTGLGSVWVLFGFASSSAWPPLMPFGSAAAVLGATSAALAAWNDRRRIALNDE